MEAPKIPSFIKTKYQFKRFHFQPRYYDADKEKLELRKKRIEKELSGNTNSIDKDLIERKERMKMSFEESWSMRRSRDHRKSNFRILVIVVILVLVLYVIKQNLGI